ncbi:AAA family ATPase [Aspergillus sclerotialis]|uniref:AAA family ATPase n=1 Tax=Aspergillus sclerotialis TaxID=2070753 RepID=A0A3A3A4V9_9EURO|nr:AAA family ATPase [Aspergillus sclerotialis]
MGESIKYASPGSICEVHNLYKTNPDKSGRTSWTKTYPDDLVEPAENEESSQYALIVRNDKCYDGRKSLEVHSIVVQSKQLKTFLGKVMKGYPGITMDLDRVEFNKPFKPFVHRWKQFVEARDNEQEVATKAHVDLLYKVVEEELRDIIASKNDLVANGVVTYDLLWTIFEPGEIIFSVVDGRDRAFIFESGNIDQQTGKFCIKAKFIEYDGTKFGTYFDGLAVPPFEGTSPITDLKVFPLVYHSNSATVRRDLIARGKLWEDHAGYHYKQYEGGAKTYFCNREIKFHIKSRIVIDADAYNTFNPGDEVDIYYSKEKLSDDDRLIATPIIRGYALKDKRWLEFYIDGVKDITWNEQAFDSLVLPHAQQDLKQLILAFAESQSKNIGDFDDIIQGKGRGVIMLLSGPPGVGKTLTAESVAEVMKVPLYVLSAGDLGTTASTVEDSLKDILSIVPRWGAVLLLDEADVFMEARNSSDLKRNELVSIFLRMLEYYEGFLFLTSNRAENIDPAFESRIHVSLRYPELNKTSRRQIWTQFLGDAYLEGFSSQQLDQLGEMELNGRQIKNVLRTAHLLARKQGVQLTYGHVQTILNLRISN